MIGKPSLGSSSSLKLETCQQNLLNATEMQVGQICVLDLTVREPFTGDLSSEKPEWGGGGGKRNGRCRKWESGVGASQSGRGLIEANGEGVDAERRKGTGKTMTGIPHATHGKSYALKVKATKNMHIFQFPLTIHFS